LLGAVKTPSRVQLLRPNVRLPELLAAVGGLTDKAGKTVVILPAEKSWCSESAVLRQNVELGWPLAYRLDEALSANEKLAR
jgi:protein involved in polysaccharide export with SLBB domain